MYFAVNGPFTPFPAYGTYHQPNIPPPLPTYRSKNFDDAQFPSMGEVKSAQMTIPADCTCKIREHVCFPNLIFTLQEIIDGLAKLKGNESSIPDVYLVQGLAAQAIGGPVSRTWRLAILVEQPIRIDEYRSAILAITKQLIDDKINQELRLNHPELAVSPFPGDTLAKVYRLKHGYYETYRGWTYRIGSLIGIDVIYDLTGYAGSSHLDGWVVSFHRKFGYCFVKGGVFQSTAALNQAADHVRHRHFVAYGTQILGPMLIALADGADIKHDIWNRARMEFIEHDDTALAKLLADLPSGSIREQWIDFLHVLLLVKDDPILCRRAIDVWIKKCPAVNGDLAGILHSDPKLVPHFLQVIQGMAFFTWVKPDVSVPVPEQKVPCQMAENMLKHQLQIPVQAPREKLVSPVEMWDFDFNTSQQTRPFAAIVCAEQVKRHLLLVDPDLVHCHNPLAVSERFCSSMRHLEQLETSLEPLQAILKILGFNLVPPGGFSAVIASLSAEWQKTKIQTLLACHWPHHSPLVDPYKRRLPNRDQQSLPPSLVLPSPVLSSSPSKVAEVKQLSPGRVSSPPPAAIKKHTVRIMPPTPAAMPPPLAESKRSLKLSSEREWPRLQSVHATSSSQPKKKTPHVPLPKPQRTNREQKKKEPVQVVLAKAVLPRPTVTVQPPGSRFEALEVEPVDSSVNLPVTVAPEPAAEKTTVAAEPPPVVELSASALKRRRKKAAADLAKKESQEKVTLPDPEQKTAGVDIQVPQACAKTLFEALVQNQQSLDNQLILQAICALAGHDSTWTDEQRQTFKQSLLMLVERPGVLQLLRSASTPDLALKKRCHEILYIDDMLNIAEPDPETMRETLVTLAKLWPLYQAIDQATADKTIKDLYNKCLEKKHGFAWTNELLHLQSVVNIQTLDFLHYAGLIRLFCRTPFKDRALTAVDDWMAKLQTLADYSNNVDVDFVNETYLLYFQRMLQKVLMHQSNAKPLHDFIRDTWGAHCAKRLGREGLVAARLKTHTLACQVTLLPYCWQKLLEAGNVKRLKTTPPREVFKTISDEIANETIFQQVSSKNLPAYFSFTYACMQGYGIDEMRRISLIDSVKVISVYQYALMTLESNFIIIFAKKFGDKEEHAKFVKAFYDSMKMIFESWVGCMSEVESTHLKHRFLALGTNVMTNLCPSKNPGNENKGFLVNLAELTASLLKIPVVRLSEIGKGIREKEKKDKQ